MSNDIILRKMKDRKRETIFLRSRITNEIIIFKFVKIFKAISRKMKERERERERERRSSFEIELPTRS